MYDYVCGCGIGCVFVCDHVACGYGFDKMSHFRQSHIGRHLPQKKATTKMLIYNFQNCLSGQLAGWRNEK